MDITDAQWKIIKPLIKEPKPREDGRGRERIEPRSILNGILWILKTGARWQDLPDRYPSYQSCHRRFQEWTRNGTIEKILLALARDLEERGGIDIEESFIDGTFVSAKKGGSKSGKQSVAKGPRSWQWQTLPVFLSPAGLKALRHIKSLS